MKQIPDLRLHRDIEATINFNGKTILPFRHPKPLVQSAATGQDDSDWLITLSDLTLLLLCFLGVWYVKDRPTNHATIPPDRIAISQIAETKKFAIPSPTIDWAQVKAELQTHTEELGLISDVQIERTGEELLLSISETVSFASGRADVRSRALPMLDRVAFVALSHPSLHLEVGGHTDDRPIASVRFPSNWELSTARASAVARFLVQKGIHPRRIAVEGFANYKPLAPNTSVKSRSVNRRVEIRLYTLTPQQQQGH